MFRIINRFSGYKGCAAIADLLDDLRKELRKPVVDRDPQAIRDAAARIIAAAGWFAKNGEREVKEDQGCQLRQTGTVAGKPYRAS